MSQRIIIITIHSFSNCFHPSALRNLLPSTELASFQSKSFSELFVSGDVLRWSRSRALSSSPRSERILSISHDVGDKSISSIICFMSLGILIMRAIFPTALIVTQSALSGNFLNTDVSCWTKSIIPFIPGYLSFRIVPTMLSHEGDGLFEGMESFEVLDDFSIAYRR